MFRIHLDPCGRRSNCRMRGEIYVSPRASKNTHLPRAKSNAAQSGRSRIEKKKKKKKKKKQKKKTARAALIPITIDLNGAPEDSHRQMPRLCATYGGRTGCHRIQRTGFFRAPKNVGYREGGKEIQGNTARRKVGRRFKASHQISAYCSEAHVPPPPQREKKIPFVVSKAEDRRAPRGRPDD